MAVAVFDYALWAARYPELAPKVAEPLAAAYFLEAGLYLDNTDASLVADASVRLLYLNMLVAHIAALNGASPAGAAGAVGRISSVTQGSVSTSFDYSIPAGSGAWYAQTKYGAAYWAATAQYRTMQYLPGPRPFLGVPGPGGAAWPR